MAKKSIGHLDKDKRAGAKTISKKYLGRALSQDEKRYLLYLGLALVLLILFAIEPGFFLGLIIGALGYRYYIDNIK